MTKYNYAYTQENITEQRDSKNNMVTGTSYD